MRFSQIPHFPFNHRGNQASVTFFTIHWLACLREIHPRFSSPSPADHTHPPPERTTKLYSKKMALTKCKECGAVVSTKAEACPRCGAKQVAVNSGYLSAIIISALLVVAVIAISGGGKSSSSRSFSISSGDAPTQSINWGVPAEPTPAYMLVCNDTGERGISASDPRIARYQRAIDAIRMRFKISETMIGDQTWTAVDTLRKQGMKTSGIEIMEGVVGMKEAEQLGVSYTEIVAALMTLMQPKSTR